jgi:putative peptidoglycan lipid II flippase
VSRRARPGYPRETYDRFDDDRFDDPGVIEPGSNPADTETSLVRSSALVAVGTALSRVTGFARIAAIAYALGASTLAGTYSYANEAPNIVYELLLGGVLTATLVPLFVRYHETHDEDAPSAIFTVAIVALAAVTLAGVLAAPWIVDLYTLNAKGGNLAQQQELATALLRLLMPQMLFYGIAALATAMLNAQRRFLAAAFAPVLNNAVAAAVFVMLPRLADGSLTVDSVLHDDALIILIGLGTTAGVVVMALALLPPLARLHTHLRFLPRWRHPAVLLMLRLSGWTVGYVIANQIALLIVTILANGTDGGPFIYISAYAFFQLPHGLFAVSLMTTFTPELARAATRDNLPALRLQVSRGIRLAALVIVPASAMYIGLARPIIVALLQRGSFDAADASAVSDTLLAFSVGLLPFSVYLFAMRAFYARHDTFTPFWLNCIENAVNIALAFPFYAWLGIPGLALAFSSSYAVAAVVTLIVLRAQLRGIDGAQLWSSLSRIVAAGVAVGAVSWAVGELIGWASFEEAVLAVVAGALAGGVVYLGLLVLLRVEELSAIRALVPARLRARS